MTAPIQAADRPNVAAPSLGDVFVARARIRLGWVGEYSTIDEVRSRTRGSALEAIDDF